jgi:hypothetical protein
VNRYIEVEKFDNRYEVKAIRNCGIQWTADGCTHYTAALLRAGEVYLNFDVAEDVTFRAVGPDGQPLETVHGSWRSREEAHARHLAEAKARLVTVEAEHLEIVFPATGLRRAILELHGPSEMGPYIACAACEGYDGGFLPFPCDTYILARDWGERMTPAGMEAAIRPFYEPCERRLREWVESNHVNARVNRLDLKRLMCEYDRRGSIKQAAAAYIKSCLCNGGTDEPELNADISAKWRALADAVEGETP